MLKVNFKEIVKNRFKLGKKKKSKISQFVILILISYKLRVIAYVTKASLPSTLSRWNIVYAVDAAKHQNFKYNISIYHNDSAQFWESPK